MTNPSAKKIFWTSALLSRMAISLFVLTSGVGLMPDEAQYWTWSQFLDLGYYSKPPGISWQIALGTGLFGNNEFGVRALSLILPLFSALIITRIVKECTNSTKAAYFAATAFILSPIGMTGSFLATTDNGLILFWLMATWFITKPTDRFTGVAIALGALWKWMIYSLWIGVLITKPKQGYRAIFKGVCISLLGLLPALWWNYHNDWATFRHAAAAVGGHHTETSPSNPMGFLLAGIALISPGFLLLSIPSFIQYREDPKRSFLHTMILIVWGGLFVLSCFRKVQGNWAIAAEALLFPFIGMTLYKKPSWQGWPFITACTLSLLLQGLILLGPYGLLLQLSPLKKGMGSDQIATHLLDAGYHMEKNFLFSDRYQTTSQIWFYGPGQRKTYFFNIHNLRNNQFMFWPGMPEECVGKTGYFVSIIPGKEASKTKQRIRKFTNLLSPYFDSVTPVTQKWLYSRHGDPVRYMIVLRAENYSGKTPDKSLKY